MNKNKSFSYLVKKYLSEKTLQDFGMNVKGKEKFDTESIGIFFSLLPYFYTIDEKGDLFLESDNQSFLELCAYAFIKFLSVDTKVVEADGKYKLIAEGTKLCTDLEKIFALPKEDKENKIFVRCLFILCGTVLDPQKGYHLSFSYRKRELLDKLSEVLLYYGIEGKIILQNNLYFYYLKDSEKIEDLLSLMGAEKFSLEIIGMKAEKSIRNDINRKQNFDDANIKKSVDTAQKIIFDIKYLKEADEFDKLPESLKIAAELRCQNPESSLRELCDIFPEPITKSGLNHRFIKICSMASEIRRRNK